MCEKFDAPVTSLPSGFPAYCVYVPSGMAEDFTQTLVRSLRVWGRNMGKNLFVCYWDIGAPEFIGRYIPDVLFKNRIWVEKP